MGAGGLAQEGWRRRAQLPTSTSPPRAAARVAAVSVPGPQFTQMAARRQSLKIIQAFFFFYFQRLHTHLRQRLSHTGKAGFGRLFPVHCSLNTLRFWVLCSPLCSHLYLVSSHLDGQPRSAWCHGFTAARAWT